MKKILIALTTLTLAGAGLVAVATPANAWAYTASASSACQVVDGVNTGKAVITGSFTNTEPVDPKYTMGVTMEAVGTVVGPNTVASGDSTSFTIVTDVPLAAGSAKFVMTWAKDDSKDSFSKNYGAVDKCEVPPKPTPSPTPTPEPTPPPQPEPPKDFCPDLEGIQWEGYDCLTPTATPEPPVVEVPVVETPVSVPLPSAGIETLPVTVPAPATVAVPAAATVPNAVPAGDGSSQPNDISPWLVFGLAGLGVVAALGFALINRNK